MMIIMMIMIPGRRHDTESSRRPPTPAPCAKSLRAAYSDPPPVIPVPESIAAQAAYRLIYKNIEYYSWVSSGPKCFQVLGGSLTKPATESHVVNRQCVLSV